MIGTGWGTRYYRFRVQTQAELELLENTLGSSEVQFDVAERLCSGAPARGSNEATIMIAAIKYADSVSRNRGKGYSVTHRLSWTDSGGTPELFGAAATSLWDNVLQYTPCRSLSVDNANANIVSAADAAAALKIIKENTGIENVSWGACFNTEAIASANYAMLCVDPVSLSVSESLINLANSAGYPSIVSHIDEPTAWQEFISTRPTLADQEAAFTTLFQQQKVPWRIPIYQASEAGGVLYDYTSILNSYFAPNILKYNDGRRQTSFGISLAGVAALLVGGGLLSALAAGAAKRRRKL